MAVKKYLLVAACVLSPVAGCSNFAISQAGASVPATASRTLLPSAQSTDDVVVGGQSLANINYWEAFRGRMSLTGENAPAEIAPEIAWLRQHPQYLHHSLRRGVDYLPFLSTEASRHGIPSELVLIPALESGFNPRSAGGAGPTGLWQLTADTANTLSVKRNAYYDGRKDILESTEASMRYLASLGKTFDGNWMLAVAAYNVGPGTIQRTFRAPYSRVTIGDIHRSRLPAHTKAYLERLLAVSWVIRNDDPKALPAVQANMQVQAISFKRALPVSRIIAEAGLEPADVLPFNTGLLRDQIHPMTPQRILVRKDVAWKIASVDWSRTEAASPAKVAASPVSMRYVVAGGDTLVGIARRYGISVEALKAQNSLKANGLSVGQVLVVPSVRESALPSRPSLR